MLIVLSFVLSTNPYRPPGANRIARAPGLMEACEILFGEDARAKYEEYFADLAYRESLTPAPGSTPPEEISHPA